MKRKENDKFLKYVQLMSTANLKTKAKPENAPFFRKQKKIVSENQLRPSKFLNKNL